MGKSYRVKGICIRKQIEKPRKERIKVLLDGKTRTETKALIESLNFEIVVVVLLEKKAWKKLKQ